MQPASNLLLKFSQRLFKDAEIQSKFVDALTNPQSFNPCILWTKEKPAVSPFKTEAPLSWQPEFVDRLAMGEKPGQHPLHHEGYFYCLDFSSVFAASTLLTIEGAIDSVIDVCAAPGGKSLFAQRTLRPQLLLSNEVIGKRIGALLSNLKRCRIDESAKVVISSLDSKVLAEEMPQVADLVLVDAPCTGQSLLAKGDKVPGCFHPVNINKNANRQKRILANSAQLVAPQGYLAYMTCAYSIEENEQVSQWFLERFPHFQPLVIEHLKPYQSRFTDRPCYRIFPHDRLGAGSFTILFQNTNFGEKPEITSAFFDRPGLKII